MTTYYFVGGFFANEMDEYVSKNSKGYVQTAANTFQQSILRGIYINVKENDEIKVFNLPFVGGYPRHFLKRVVPQMSFRFDNELINSTRFNNIKYYKNISRYINLMKDLDKSLSNDKGKDVKIIIYSMHTPFIKAVSQVKKKYRFSTCLIIPDLPEYMNLGKPLGYFSNMLKKIDTKLLMRNMKSIDYYILLTSFMIDKLPRKPFKVLEGISNVPESIVEVEREKILLYTGTLDEKYGILDFLKVFIKLDFGEYKVRLFGYGDSVEEINRLEEKFPEKIEYKGIIPYSEVLTEQRKASFLLNPRSTKEEYTKYSFPSKLMEYLSVGTPVISTKLLGIPESYHPFLNILEDESVEALILSLNTILSTEESTLKEKSKQGKKFVRDYKNNKVQTKKIIDIFKEN